MDSDVPEEPVASVFRVEMWAVGFSKTFVYTKPRTQHDCHHDTKVKTEAATAFIELLMMGGKTPETC